MGFYKNGNPKYKTKIIDIPLSGCGIDSYHTKKTKDGKSFLVNSSVLTKVLGDSLPTSGQHKIVSGVLEYRRLHKLLNTYLKNLEKFRWEHDGCIHQNLHHCATDTGRLSSSRPNLQNIPRKSLGGVKDVFTSRFDGGLIAEIDYKQLEMVCLALVSGDKNLIRDLSSGVDIHTERAEELFRTTKATEDQRRICKVLNFGLIYGAGSKLLAANAGIDVVTAKRFILQFYTAYPRVKEWNEEVAREVVRTREHIPGQRTKLGRPSGRGRYTSITGRKYVFKEYDTVYGHRDVSFSPTEMKNYPVQGLATGDIVPMMMGKLLRYLFAEELNSTFYLTNQIHDSIMIDVDVKNVPDIHAALNGIKDLLESVPFYLEETFGIKTDLPFKVDIKTGPSWGKLEEYK